MSIIVVVVIIIIIIKFKKNYKDLTLKISGHMFSFLVSFPLTAYNNSVIIQ